MHPSRIGKFGGPRHCWHEVCIGRGYPPSEAGFVHVHVGWQEAGLASSFGDARSKRYDNFPNDDYGSKAVRRSGRRREDKHVRRADANSQSVCTDYRVSIRSECGRR
ncbi:MAG: hypothetical protein EB143_02915 [Actinobacteria bacterium]|nr:hypothetical protein [Actinomycetota bacterium]